jgi:hypothetical protein
MDGRQRPTFCPRLPTPFEYERIPKDEHFTQPNRNAGGSADGDDSRDFALVVAAVAAAASAAAAAAIVTGRQIARRRLETEG